MLWILTTELTNWATAFIYCSEKQNRSVSCVNPCKPYMRFQEGYLPPVKCNRRRFWLRSVSTVCWPVSIPLAQSRKDLPKANRGNEYLSRIFSSPLISFLSSSFAHDTFLLMWRKWRDGFPALAPSCVSREASDHFAGKNESLVSSSSTRLTALSSGDAHRLLVCHFTPPRTELKASQCISLFPLLALAFFLTYNHTSYDS